MHFVSNILKSLECTYPQIHSIQILRPPLSQCFLWIYPRFKNYRCQIHVTGLVWTPPRNLLDTKSKRNVFLKHWKPQKTTFRIVSEVSVFFFPYHWFHTVSRTHDTIRSRTVPHTQFFPVYYLQSSSRSFLYLKTPLPHSQVPHKQTHSTARFFWHFPHEQIAGNSWKCCSLAINMHHLDSYGS